MFLDFAKENGSVPNVRRRPLGQPTQHLSGSTTRRKLDVSFAKDTKTNESFRYDWSQILVPGELKSNPNTDRHMDTWLDLARYARLVLTAQDTRRFVLGFTLCGSIMRLWEFNRLGGIASSPFDINKDGLQFVSAVLGYLWMDEEQLGFDPTISESDGKRYFEITRNDRTERLVIVELMKRHSSVAGRATTCWKTYRDGDESKRILVVKDSWQYPEREEEGKLLREATEKGVVNVARYYHHETVRVGGKVDDIYDNVRKGLDITEASNAFRCDSATSNTEGMMPPPSISGTSVGSAHRSRSKSITRKRSSGSINAPLPPSKRSRSNSQHGGGGSSVRPNRVHRRVILRDYGKNIYKASSRVAMLAALEGNIEGHESLRDLTGTIQSDVSIGNLMMNEEEDNPSWPSFLIDLDLAIKEDRNKSSGAPNKTGTRAFMAIGALYGEKRTFMHDLESFFWVLFWICIHYTGPNGESRVVPKFEKWNYEETEELAKIKEGTVAREEVFIKTITEGFTPYYQPFIPLMKKLRRVVFPKGKPWEEKDRELYSQMKAALEKAREDPDVLMEFLYLNSSGVLLNQEDGGGCLLDLNLAMKMWGEESSEASSEIGTRAFMAIGALMGEKHSFMHDLESFFWVLFWICIHYTGPNGECRVVPRFERWNYVDMKELAKTKKGEVADEGDFIKTVEENFTPYYQPLIPWANRLRKVVFPDGGRWKKKDWILYSQMKEVLRKAIDDPNVLAE